MTVVAVTADGKKLATFSVSSTVTVNATSTGGVIMPISSAELRKVLGVVGITRVDAGAGIVAGYIVAYDSRTLQYEVSVSVYNPTTTSATYTVTVEGIVIGV
jgi:hypothetical protein